MTDQTATTEPPKAGVSDDEFRETLTIPAIFANRVVLSKTTGGARLTFLEKTRQTLDARVAVVLPYQDALALRDLLSRQLKEIEDQLKAPGETPTHG